MNSFKKTRIICLLSLLGIILVSGFLSETSYASCPDPVALADQALRHKDINTDNDDEIIKASQSKDVLIRDDAIVLLEAKLGKKGIPALKQLLNDKIYEIRLKAAHSLAMLGDESGHEQMIKDFEQYYPKEEPNDLNILNDVKKLEKWKKRQSWYAGTTLEIGKVLAEYGDFRAYNLAVNIGLSANDLEYSRSRSAEVLGEIGKRSSGKLKEDAVAALSGMAEKEKDRVVFEDIYMAGNKIGGESEIKILEKAVTNSYQREDNIKISRAILKDAKKKMEHKFGPLVEPNNSSEPNSSPEPNKP